MRVYAAHSLKLSSHPLLYQLQVTMTADTLDLVSATLQDIIKALQQGITTSEQLVVEYLGEGLPIKLP